MGEYGLDINNGASANPATFEDFMSYCSPRWISKFTCDFLTNINVLSPAVVPSGAAAAPRHASSKTSRGGSRARCASCRSSW